MISRRIATRERARRRRARHAPGSLPGNAARLFLWESLVLGVFGAVASVVVGTMAAGVFNSANIQLPLSLQLFLMSDSFELSVIPS
ncbi:MAG TPA: hypothetical protein VGC79_37530, partial [Polyangiaceae bacterium]